MPEPGRGLSRRMPYLNDLEQAIGTDVTRPLDGLASIEILQI